MSERRVSRMLDCNDPPTPVARALEEEIQVAALSDVPVLISADPAASREIACELERRSPAAGGGIFVIECTRRGAIDAIRPLIPREGHSHDRGTVRTVLLQEVHGLSLSDQAELEQQLARILIIEDRRQAGVRILASSSVRLFDRVAEESFLDRLYYLLNMIHILVPADGSAPEPDC